ncbi:unnamed protein product [Phaedon cochleariae]|uniref:Uncharacterized protein n=1 Tax=Phaedon cochleariae TaxID=80249 RepID=A0A9N9SDQ1_PHACE|nr:unnamed protein product [Phaedon cochleariae]
MEKRDNVQPIEKLALIELESRMNSHNSLPSEFDEVQTAIEMLVEENELEMQFKVREEFDDCFHKVIAICKEVLEFDEVQTAIAMLVEENELEMQFKVREEFDDCFHKVIAICKEVLGKFDVNMDEILDDSVSQRSAGPSIHNSRATNHNAIMSQPKIPSIPIPKFNGVIDTWLEFRDTFRSLIHENDSIGNIEKFHFLRGALDGDARQINQRESSHVFQPQLR